MNDKAAMPNRDISYYRIVALWATCEGFAGGIMHALSLPFTGIIISGMAVLCLCLLGWYFHKPSAIIKATLMVVIFKMMLSPHSPPTAYIAVLFQGMLAAFFFQSRKQFHARACIFAILVMVESALQRIFVLWIIYSKSFWSAIEAFVEKLFHQQPGVNHLLYWLAGIYVMVHFIAGWLAGHFASGFAQNSHTYLHLTQHNLMSKEISRNIQRGKRIRWFSLAIWFILLTLLLQSIIRPAHAWLPQNEIGGIIIRAILVLGAWYFILGPLFMKLLKRFLSHKKIAWAESLHTVQLMLPEMKNILLYSIQSSKKENGISRAKLFLRTLLANVLFRNTKEA